MKAKMFWIGAMMMTQVSAASPVTTVDQVDLNRYVGAWYEIASIPQWFQKDCEKGVMAEYSTLDSGRIRVVNSCLQKNGEKKETIGEARIVDSVSNAKLEVSFFKLFGKYVYAFGGDYWVIDLEANYNYAVVGHPSRNYGWILARNPRLADSDLQRISENLQGQGYDTCKFNMSIQDGGNTTVMPLCEYLKSL